TTALIGPAEVHRETEILFCQVTVQDRVYARHEAVASFQVLCVHPGDQCAGRRHQRVGRTGVVDAEGVHAGLHLLAHQPVYPLVEFHGGRGPLDEIEFRRWNALCRRDGGDHEQHDHGNSHTNVMNFIFHHRHALSCPFLFYSPFLPHPHPYRSPRGHATRRHREGALPSVPATEPERSIPSPRRPPAIGLRPPPVRAWPRSTPWRPSSNPSPCP